MRPPAPSAGYSRARAPESALFLLLACTETEPKHVEARDLDMALSRGDRASLCAGLKMKDPEVRTTAARHLAEFTGDSACLCERVKYDDRWDAAILKGVEGVKDDAKVGCLGSLLDDAAAPDRVELARALHKIPAPAVRARLKKAATEDADAAVRAYAIALYAESKDPADVKMLTDGLAQNADPSWRASAATALSGRPEARELLEQTAKSDADPRVRASALAALKNTQGYAFAPLGCAALSDPAPEVRTEAAALFRATTDAAAIACLREKMLAEEAHGGVRAALLKTLRGSPSPGAADILCEAEAFWITTYVKDEEVKAESDVDILFAQNDRDFDRSMECLEKAMKSARGWSCQGRAYASSWRYHLGGPRQDVKCD